MLQILDYLGVFVFALSGGVLQNAVLQAALQRHLEGLPVLLHHLLRITGVRCFGGSC